MKDNYKLFIKYLDNQMSSEELESFNSELNENLNLKRELNDFRKVFNKGNNIEVDERYFSTLLPNAKSRISKSESNKIIKYALIAPAIILVIFFLFKPIEQDSTVKDYNLESFWEVVSSDEELTKNFVNESIILGHDYLTDSLLIDEVYNQELILDETVFDYLENHFSLNDINNNLVDSLSEIEFNNLYENIIDKKILGMK